MRSRAPIFDIVLLTCVFAVRGLRNSRAAISSLLRPPPILATGLGAGILVDAVVVRALMVPAMVALFGRWNWWMPFWLARILRIPAAPITHRAQPASQLERAA